MITLVQDYHFGSVIKQPFRFDDSFQKFCKVFFPMGTNCAPLLADLFLYSYENDFLDKLIKEGKRKLARKFNLSYRYIDDLISFNNKRFKEFISDIYPKELTISETTESTSVASYLDLLFIRDNSNNITTKLHDKRDTFGFHIVNFLFMSSNIPSAPAYCVYASQLIRYARCCSNYGVFLSRHRSLVTRLLSQGYKANHLSNTFKKFYGRHTDLVGQWVCRKLRPRKLRPRKLRSRKLRPRKLRPRKLRPLNIFQRKALFSSFSRQSISLASAECLKSVKSLKNEEFQEVEN